MANAPKHPSQPAQPFADWLPLLAQLYPPKGALLIGAGSGTGPLVKALQCLGITNTTLVEADDDQFVNLQRNLSKNPDWRIRKQVVAAHADAVTFHRASHIAENGLIPPEALRSLWPNIQSFNTYTCNAVPLSQIQADTQSTCRDPANWILIDCFPALPLLLSANQSFPFDVVVLRVVLGNITFPEIETAVNLTFTSANSILTAHGYRNIGVEESRNPSIGHALFVRDTAKEARKLQEQLTDQTQNWRTQQELLAHAHQAIERIQLEKNSIQASAALADARAREATEKADAMTLHMQQLNRAKAEAERQATDRQHLIEKLNEAAAHSEKESLRITSLHREQLEKFEQRLEQTSLQKNQLREIEARIRSDLTNGISNAVKQLEAFIGIQSFLTTGESIPAFHGWPISPDLGVFLLEQMRAQHYDLIIEFGSGTSTSLLAKAAEILGRNDPRKEASRIKPASITRIVSFEHDALYYEKTLKMLKARGLEDYVQLTHAPLVEWNESDTSYLFYDCKESLNTISRQYTTGQSRILLLIDGPPGSTCPNARYPAVPHVFEALGENKIDVVLDDATRPAERYVIELWQRYWKQRSHRYHENLLPSEKGLYYAEHY